MKISQTFSPTEAEIDRLISENPLAQVISRVEAGLFATPLPLMIERDAAGNATLLGHFARANPHVEYLRRDPEALVIFMGPHNYMSPSWLSDRTQAPTWNFATVHMSVRINLDDSVEAGRAAVVQLTEKMESGRPKPWVPTELGERYERLLRGVIAFRAPISAVRAKFKLGQNERDDVLGEGIAALRNEPKPDLARLMERANAHRKNPADSFGQRIGE